MAFLQLSDLLPWLYRLKFCKHLHTEISSFFFFKYTALQCCLFFSFVFHVHINANCLQNWDHVCYAVSSDFEIRPNSPTNILIICLQEITIITAFHLKHHLSTESQSNINRLSSFKYHLLKKLQEAKISEVVLRTQWQLPFNSVKLCQFTPQWKQSSLLSIRPSKHTGHLNPAFSL